MTQPSQARLLCSNVAIIWYKGMRHESALKVKVNQVFFFFNLKVAVVVDSTGRCGWKPVSMQQETTKKKNRRGFFLFTPSLPPRHFCSTEKKLMNTKFWFYTGILDVCLCHIWLHIEAYVYFKCNWRQLF